eukprot:403352557
MKNIHLNQIKHLPDQYLKQEGADCYYEYFTECQKKNIYPISTGIVKGHGLSSQYLNLKDFSIGHEYASSILDTLLEQKVRMQLKYNLKVINFKNNRLSDENMIKLFKSESTINIEEIDISDNHMTDPKLVLKQIGDFLDLPNQRLVTLNLQNCKIGDYGLNHLNYGLRENYVLMTLNLSDNHITDNGSKYLQRIIKTNRNIACLLLRWNQLSNKSGRKIASTLKNNQQIKIIDLSFNSLGTDDNLYNYLMKKQNDESSEEPLLKSQVLKKLSAMQFQKCFQQNKTLIHIDLSHNNFGYQECKILNEGLKVNQNILGIHMLGNKMDTDAKGFLTRDQKIYTLPGAYHLQTIIKDQLKRGVVDHQLKIELKANSNCWICEGWACIKFEHKPILDEIENSPKTKITQIFLNLSIDNYKPDLMVLEPSLDPNKPPKYSLRRMVPPQKIRFYYTVHYKKKIAKKMQKADIIQIDKASIIEEIDEIMKIDEQEVEVPRTNIIEGIIQKQDFLTAKKIKYLGCKPRETRNKRDIEKLQKFNQWKRVNSYFFKNYFIDSEQTLTKCFEFDWQCGKIPKLVKDSKDLENLKNLLRVYYRKFRETYKYHAGIQMVQGVPAIGTNVLNEIVTITNLADGKNLKLSDVDVEFIATNVSSNYQGKLKHMNPDRHLCRFEFLELIVRFAITKFKKQKITNSITQMVEKLFSDNLSEFFSQFSSQNWRDERLWNRECEQVFEYFLPMVKALFQKFSIPGKNKFAAIGYDQFLKIIQCSMIVSQYLPPREISVAFNQSMMTQVNEIDFERHCHMTFEELIDGLGRIADKLSNSQIDYLMSLQDSDTIDEQGSSQMQKKESSMIDISTISKGFQSSMNLDFAASSYQKTPARGGAFNFMNALGVTNNNTANQNGVQQQMYPLHHKLKVYLKHVMHTALDDAFIEQFNKIKKSQSQQVGGRVQFNRKEIIDEDQ